MDGMDGSTGGSAPITRHDSATKPLARQVAGSLARFPRLVSSSALRLRRDRVGRRYRLEPHGTFHIFRETVQAGAPDRGDTVLTVGFRLRVLRSTPLLHWMFQRACLLTTPFWCGFPGFRVKLWMVDPSTHDYAGIYAWSGEANTHAYVDALVKVLRPLSTPRSVWYEVLPDTDFESYLREKEAPQEEPAFEPRTLQ